MKRILSSFIAAAMVFTCLGFGTVSVNAVEKNSADKSVTLNKDKEPSYKEGEALVVFRGSSSMSRAGASETIGLQDDMEIDSMWDFSTSVDISDDGSILKRMSGASSSGKLNIALVKSDKYSTEELIAKLKAEKNVRLAEPNYRIKARTTDDTYFGRQWNLENSGQNKGTEGSSTNTAAKWDKGITGSAEKVVAVVDTGVDYTHEDLKNNMWDNQCQPDLRGECGFDFINGDTDPMDDNGHGTHCAGIIGAEGNNGTGISGVNQDVSIMALKILDEDGSGYASGEVSAYHYINKALTLGVDVVAINNSWGGGESSDIFELLVDIVGEKGAVTVCAAGNEYSDNDKYEDYPSSVESPYLLSVAASNENNELAAFSNYGSSTVDIAAPGADILSTVSYGCYNPSIYDSTKQKEISAEFNDFESAENEWAVPDEDTVISRNASYSGEVSTEECFGEAGGRSLKISFSNVKKGQLTGVRIPYDLDDDYKPFENYKRISMMVKANGPQVDSADDEGGLLFAVDVDRGMEFSDIYDVIEVDNAAGTMFSGESNYWDHFELDCGDYSDSPEKERDIVLMIYPSSSGDYEMYLDDIGISKTITSEDSFGKYDFYNGTSMAAPHVTGAVALAAAEEPDADSESLIDMVLTHVRREDSLRDKVVSGGVLDFSCTEELCPRIGSVTVKTSDKTITIKGGGFNESTTVKFNGTEAEITSRTNKSLVIKDNGWINDIVDIEVTGRGKTIKKESVYLVKGKTAYTALDEYFEFPSSEGILSSNGKRIYCADSSTDMIYSANPADGKYMDFEDIFAVKPEKYFKKDSESKADYDFSFGKDLPYADGKLYNIAAYSEVGTSGGGDDEDWAQDWIIIDDDDDYEIETGAAYSSQYKLMAFDLNTGKITDLGSLPKDISRTEEWTLTSYNGKIYVIGGYDYSTKSLSRKVKVYDPATKKWSSGPSLPEGRAAGKAVQSGDKLVYTMGYSESQKGIDPEKQICPVNLVLKGNKWIESAQQLDMYFCSDAVKRNGNEYCVYDTSVGICSTGLIYAGQPAARLGDTFTYNVSKDKYYPTKYNFSDELFGNTFTGVTVGSTLYGYDDDDYAYKASISSGLVKVTAPKYKGGKVSGANVSKLPGTKVTLKAVPASGYYVRSFYVDGSKVNGRTKTIRITENQKASVSFGRYVSKISLSRTSMSLKAGSKATLTAKVSPSSATNKQVTWKSGNTRYAEVSSKGVVTAKSAGIGKTVTITAAAKDGSGKRAVCKVKITR